jgi:hypothetical protein
VYVLVAGLIGAIVGAAELVSRYRDAPAKAILCWTAGTYVLINAVASGSALALIQAFGWTFGAGASAGAAWVQTFVAGFGAMGLFRSSLFIVRVGGQDVGAGPSSLLQIALGAADRGVDRKRAAARAARVPQLMSGLNFGKAVIALPTYCLALMQNVGPQEQGDLGKSVDQLRQSHMDDASRLLNLGLVLMNVVGEAALDSAIKSLGQAIRD